MIFFFGTRPGTSELKALTNVSCPHCEQVDTLIASKQSNWFHFFWIKVFKFSSNIIAECSHCKRVYYEEEFSEEMKNKMNPFQLN